MLSEEIAKLLFEVHASVNQRHRKPSASLDELFGATPETWTLRLANALYSQTNVLQIKTVPMFHLSRRQYTWHPCLLFARALKAVGVSTDSSPLEHTFSGSYLIGGWKHTITKGNAHSEFLLAKSLSSLTENEMMSVEDRRDETGMDINENEFNGTEGGLIGE